MSRMPPRGMLTILSARERSGQLEALLADHETDAGADRHQEQQGQQQIADDDERIARALGSLLRRRHALGLERGTRAARRDARSAVQRSGLHRRIGIAGAGNGAPGVGRQRRRGRRSGRGASVAVRLRRWPAAALRRRRDAAVPVAARAVAARGCAAAARLGRRPAVAVRRGLAAERPDAGAGRPGAARGAARLAAEPARAGTDCRDWAAPVAADADG